MQKLFIWVNEDRSEVVVMLTGKPGVCLSYSTPQCLVLNITTTNFASQGFMLRSLLRRLSENPGFGWSRFSRISRGILQFSCFWANRQSIFRIIPDIASLLLRYNFFLLFFL